MPPSAEAPLRRPAPPRLDSRARPARARARHGSRRRPRRRGRAGPGSAGLTATALSAVSVGTAARGSSRSIARPPSSLGRARHPAAHRLHEAPDHGEPDPCARPRPARRACDAVELLEQARRATPAGTPGPASSTVSRTESSLRQSPALTRICVPGGVYLMALSTTFVSASSKKIGSTRHGHGVDAGPPTARPPRRVRSGRASAPTRSSRTNTSRSARSTPASIRLRSSRFVTSRLRYSTSRSIGRDALVLVGRADSAIRAARCRPRPGSWRAASAGRGRPTGAGPTSSASLWRAISAACDSAASRSWAIACPSWSAALARSRVSVLSGVPAARDRTAQIDPMTRAAGLDADADTTVRRSDSGHGDLVARPVDANPLGRLVAGRPPQDPRDRAAAMAAAPCRCRRPRASRASSSPRAIQTRSIPVSARRLVGDRREHVAAVDGRVASRRLTRNRARASRSRARATSVRDRWSAANSPTTIPTNSSRPRLSHSPGSRDRERVHAARRTGSRRGGTRRPTRRSRRWRPRRTRTRRPPADRRRCVRDADNALQQGHRQRRPGQRRDRDGHEDAYVTFRHAHVADPTPLGRCTIAA